MRKLLLLMPLLFLMLAGTGLTCEIRIRVPEGNTYVPFYIQDAAGTWGGLSIEMNEALLKEAGCTPVYLSLPFARALQYLQSGEIDMMPNMSITEDRKAFLHFIGPELDETVLLVTRKDTRYEINAIEDLMKLPMLIGVERGKVYGREFETRRADDPVFRSRLEEVNEVNLNERKLAMGHISGFLGFGYNVMHQMRTNPLYKDFVIHPFVINKDWVYFGLSKKSVSPDLLEKTAERLRSGDRKGLLRSNP